MNSAGRWTRPILPVITMLFPGFLGAQAATIAGTVLIADSTTPIAHVVVRIVGGGRDMTATDGKYRLTVSPGKCEIVVTALGFGVVRRVVSIAAGQTMVEDFILSANPIPLSEVVTIGTRTMDRISTETAVPVDVVTSASMVATGLVETWQALQRLIPSANVPHIPLGDDHVRPVTLRGLAPDQVLVLIDGKRRHTSAIVQTSPVTSGTTSTDIGAIPSSAIERIEVLRDGAAAQYGSDAIAGVVNIILKKGDAREAGLTWGQIYSSEGGRRFHDGDMLNVKTSYGLRSLSGARLSFNAEFRDRGTTNRAYPDARRQYFDGDPRNDSYVPVISSHEGNGETRDFTALMNAAFPVGSGHELYGVAGTRGRKAESPLAFFRRALDDRTVRAIHPDGYLASVESGVEDHSGLLGLRGRSGNWEWDLSSVYGRNSARFDVHNSNNVTLGAASPVDFYAGMLVSSQWTSNLDVSRSFRTLRGITTDVAAGAEFRRDQYEMRQGEPDSYRDGGVRILDGPSAGRLGAVGSQGGLSLQPVDEVDGHRSNVAAYLDLAVTTSHTFLLNVAGRVEKYSDGEATSDGKMAARFEPVRGLAVRGAVGTGFRAPSLAQSHYSTTRGILRLVNGVSTAFVIRLLPVNSEPAKLLGASPLRPETSLNFSGGLVVELPAFATFTADYYDVRVDDRIVLTNEFVGPQVEKIFEDRGMRGIVGGRYFGNIVDTKTRGLDVVLNHASRLGRGLWRLTGGFNATRTRVTRVSPPPTGLSGFDTVLFNRAQRGAIERGQPRQTITLTNSYSIGRFALNLHNQRFGQASLLDIRDPARDQTVKAKWLTDLNASYRPSRQVTVTLAAANLFDVYPDEWNDFALGVNATGMSNFGIFRYPGGISPFGMNGRTVYLHLSWKYD